MNNQKLQKFTLVHYRMAPKAWKDLGFGIGQTKNLVEFGVTACNIG